MPSNAWDRMSLADQIANAERDTREIERKYGKGSPESRSYREYLQSLYVERNRIQRQNAGSRPTQPKASTSGGTGNRASTFRPASNQDVSQTERMVQQNRQRPIAAGLDYDPGNLTLETAMKYLDNHYGDQDQYLQNRGYYKRQVQGLLASGVPLTTTALRSSSSNFMKAKTGVDPAFQRQQISQMNLNNTAQKYAGATGPVTISQMLPVSKQIVDLQFDHAPTAGEIARKMDLADRQISTRMGIVHPEMWNDMNSLDTDPIAFKIAVSTRSKTVKGKGGETLFTTSQMAKKFAKVLGISDPSKLLDPNSPEYKLFRSYVSRMQTTQDTQNKNFEDAGVTDGEAGIIRRNPGLENENGFLTYARAFSTAMSPSETLGMIAGDPRDNDEIAHSTIHAFGRDWNEGMYRAGADMAANVLVGGLSPSGISGIARAGAGALGKLGGRFAAKEAAEGLTGLALRDAGEAVGKSAVENAVESGTSQAVKSGGNIFASAARNAATDFGKQLGSQIPHIIRQASDRSALTGEDFGVALAHTALDAGEQTLDQYNLAKLIHGNWAEKISVLQNVVLPVAGKVFEYAGQNYKLGKDGQILRRFDDTEPSPENPHGKYEDASLKQIRTEEGGHIRQVLGDDEVAHAVSNAIEEHHEQLPTYGSKDDIRNQIAASHGIADPERKSDFALNEAFAGGSPNPAKEAFHRKIDKSVALNYIKAEHGQKLKEIHEARSAEWAETNGQHSSNYYEQAPNLGDEIEDLTKQHVTRGQITNTRDARAGEDLNGQKNADFESLLNSPQHAEKVLNQMSQISGLKGAKDLDDVAQFMADNLIWLYNKTPQGIREKVMKTLYGANRLASQLGVRYELPIEKVGGVIAVLSAGKKWEHNVTNAERLLDIMSNRQSHVWDSKMEQKYGARLNPDQLTRVRGKSLAELTDVEDKANWIRAYDMAHNPRGYRDVNVDGTFGDFVLRKDGVRAERQWNDNKTMEKAIKIFEADGMDVVHKELGKGQKVRNFYNNIVDPYSEHPFVATDLHMVANSLLSALSGKSKEAREAFGNAPQESGIQGTSPVYLEAARRAAEHLGITNPHEIQSLAFYMGRELFTPERKRKKGIKEAIQAIWDKADSGALSREAAREEIFKLAGGFRGVPALGGEGPSYRSSFADR